MAEDPDDLNDRERQALDAFAPLAPPSDFVERVLAARAPRSARRSRRVLVAALAAACAAAVAVVVLRPSERSAHGTIAATERISTQLGDRGVAVLEAQTQLTWRVDRDGAAELDQHTGNAFYRVERGEPFVVHTPAGDVRVTGTCFRIEIEAMNPTQKMIVSGALGAAVATTVLVSVYEGHVLAQTKAGPTELPAGSRSTIGRDGQPLNVAALGIPDLDVARATREQLIARTMEQQTQIMRLLERLARVDDSRAPKGRDDSSSSEPGRLWHDPSAEKLQQWAAECHVRFDEPGLDHFTPASSVDKTGQGLEPSELGSYNAAMSEQQKSWQQLVRALYLEATGDMTGAETLSLEAMRHEIEEKSPPGERSLILQKLARERAGLQQPPTDISKTSPLERLMRAQLALGDDTETALGRKLTPARAKEIRGDGWHQRSDMSGCPSSP